MALYPFAARFTSIVPESTRSQGLQEKQEARITETGFLLRVFYEGEAVRRTWSPAAHVSYRASGKTQCIGPSSWLASFLKLITFQRLRNAPSGGDAIFFSGTVEAV